MATIIIIICKAPYIGGIVTTPKKKRCPHLDRPCILQVAQQLLDGARAAQLGKIKVGETSASEKKGGHGDFMGISWQKNVVMLVMFMDFIGDLMGYDGFNGARCI